MTAELQRDLGKHEAKIESLDERMRRVEAKLDSLIETAERAKGGWQALIAVSGISSAATAAIIKFWTALKGGG